MADQFTKDIRSTGIEQRRFRNHSSKWKFSGPANNAWPSVRTLEVEITKKQRPLKALWRQPHDSVNHNKGVIKTSNTHTWNNHASRVHSQAHAKLEARDSNTDIDLSPRGSETLGNIDDVYYSFDADASPVSSLGLDNLVDLAEANYKAREIEKLVKDEYEVLDSEGEKVKSGKRKGKKGGKPVLNHDSDFDELEDIDGDWETV